MLPVIAIPDPDDARVVFDALNVYFTSRTWTTDGETRDRILTLLIAAHAETKRTDNEETTS